MSKGSPKGRILRLNNDYTQQELEKEKRLKIMNSPRRKYLGLILITVVIVLAIPTFELVQSYHELKEARIVETETLSSSKEVEYQASSQSEMIKNLQNQMYMEKFARSNPYFYTKSNEKVFTTPSSSNNAAMIGEDE
ncbi:MAG: hypothetical protein ACK5LM_03040 [Lactovum sp.]